MKRILCIIAFCSMSLFVQASENNPKFPTLKNPSSKNPILLRADTLTGQMEHSKAQAQLLQVASNKSSTDSKIKMQVDTQRNYAQAEQLAQQDVYNQTILTCNNHLGLIGSDNMTLERRDLKLIGMTLYQVLDNTREEDRQILNQLHNMYNGLENKYCFKKPSRSRIERERIALFGVVNQRLMQINEQNLIEDDASSKSSSPNAPAQAIAVGVDPKTGYYQGWR